MSSTNQEIRDSASRTERGWRVSFGIAAVCPEELGTLVRAVTGGRGAPAVIEAVGTDDALRCALEIAGPRGTVSTVGAHHATGMPFPTGLAFARELTVRFTVGDPITLRDQVLALVRAGRVDPTRIVSHRFGLAQAPTGYALIDSRQAVKVVLTTESVAPH